MDQSITAVIILAFLFLLAVLYLSNCLKKQKDQIKLLENKSVKFSNREAVEGIVDEMSKVKMLVTSSSDAATAFGELNSKVKSLTGDAEHHKLEIGRLETDLKNNALSAKEYESNYEKKMTALLDSMKRLQQQMEIRYVQQPGHVDRMNPTPDPRIGLGNHAPYPQPPHQPSQQHYHQPGQPGQPGHGMMHYPPQPTQPTQPQHYPPIHSFSGDSPPHVATTPLHIMSGSNQGSDNLATHTKECPPSPVAIKFAEDVAAADTALETSVLKN